MNARERAQSAETRIDCLAGAAGEREEAARLIEVVLLEEERARAALRAAAAHELVAELTERNVAAALPFAPAVHLPLRPKWPLLGRSHGKWGERKALTAHCAGGMQILCAFYHVIVKNIVNCLCYVNLNISFCYL